MTGPPPGSHVDRQLRAPALRHRLHRCQPEPDPHGLVPGRQRGGLSRSLPARTTICARPCSTGSVGQGEFVARRWRAPRRTAELHVESRHCERRSLQHAFAHAVNAPRLWIRFLSGRLTTAALWAKPLGQGLVLAQHRPRRRSRHTGARWPVACRVLRTRAHVRVRTLTRRA